MAASESKNSACVRIYLCPCVHVCVHKTYIMSDNRQKGENWPPQSPQSDQRHWLTLPSPSPTHPEQSRTPIVVAVSRRRHGMQGSNTTLMGSRSCYLALRETAARPSSRSDVAHTHAGTSAIIIIEQRPQGTTRRSSAE